MVMKTLKRKWARAVTILMVISIAFAALPVLMYDVLDTGSPVWGILGVTGATVGLIARLVVRCVFLKCPCCGKGLARPYWRASESHQQFCTKCGKPFVFDDDPDENKT